MFIDTQENLATHLTTDHFLFSYAAPVPSIIHVNYIHEVHCGRLRAAYVALRFQMSWARVVK